MQENFLHFIKEHKLCEKSNKILLGISGGIDSICMFHLFRQLSFNISVAHCNFQLRKDESDKDETFVRDLCKEYEIPFFSIKFDTVELAHSKGISIQMAARELRYNWFNELVMQNNLDLISIAHNSNDVIETFLINLSRGSGIKGLTGIKPKTNNTIRPLLFASRNEISRYIQSNNFSFREDSTNKSTKYSRNLIRHELIPLFEKINPAFKNTMLENIERLHDAEQIYNSTINNKLNEIVNYKENKTFIDLEKLIQLDNIKTYLHELLYPYGFSHTQITDISLSLEAESGKKFITKTHRLIKDRTELILEELNNNSKHKYYIEANTSTINSPININFSTIKKDNDFIIEKNPKIGLIDSDLLEFPIIIRKWKQGDYFIPLGMKNLKKVSDFFIDSKLSISEKENTWILESANKIVWIIGKRIDERFKVSDSTKSILKIEIN